MTVEATTTEGGAAASETTTVTTQTPEELLASLDKPEPAATATLDEETAKKLEALDPTTLPESFRRKLETPFKADYTKKTQDLAREREKVEAERDRLLSLVEKVTADRGVTATPDEKEALRQKIREGDNEAVFALMEQMLTERVDNNPRLIELAKSDALSRATQLMPELKQYESAVGEALKGNPRLLQLAGMNKFQFAPEVIAGLAYERGYMDLKEKLGKIPALIDKVKKDAVEEYRQKVQGLPATTSRAGTTVSGDKGEKELSLRESLAEAWAEQAGSA